MALKNSITNLVDKAFSSNDVKVSDLSRLPDISAEQRGVIRTNTKLKTHTDITQDEFELTKLKNHDVEGAVENLKELKADLAEHVTEKGKKTAQRFVDRTQNKLNRDASKHFRSLDKALNATEESKTELEAAKSKALEEFEKQYTKKLTGIEEKANTFLKDKTKTFEIADIHIDSAEKISEAREALRANRDTVREFIKDQYQGHIDKRVDFIDEIKSMTGQLEEATGLRSAEALSSAAAREASVAAGVAEKEGGALLEKAGKAGKAAGFSLGAKIGMGVAALVGFDGVRRLMGSESTPTDQAVGAAEVGGAGFGLWHLFSKLGKAAGRAHV